MLNISCHSCGRLLTTLSSIPKFRNLKNFHFFENYNLHVSRPSIRFMTSQSNIEYEAEKFSKLAENWWDENGAMKALHSMNRVRVPFIRDGLISMGCGEPYTSKPLQGIKILEVGCGAGVLCEPLARLGASVLGIDASDNVLEVAKIHRDGNTELSDLQYIDADLEDIVGAGTLRFHAVVASEVVEHVEDKTKFINNCCSLLMPNGSLFLSTINRTQVSYLLAVLMAEEVLGVVPPGTHDWEMFVTTDEIKSYLNQGNCEIQKIVGMNYNPLNNKWTKCQNTSVNYILHAVKKNDINADTQ
uniref:Ubiquinone biosynthesis O-methyltransferase, mitochondrial n=2 Tax=Ciona intestinalis TaxID=7719 RepID=F7B383_CIOIN